MADKADDTNVAENQEEQGAELSELEKDALNSFSDVKGGVSDNESPQEVEVDEAEESEDKESKDKESEDEQAPDAAKTDEAEPDGEADEPDEESAETEPAAELEVEKDEAGVYEEPKTLNPGEFQPGDYSFEIKTADGKSHKLSTPEDVDAFAASLDDNPELITASQFSMFNRKSAIMEQGIASDKKAFEADKEKFDAEQNLQQTREDTLKQWNNEINYLQGRGELPQISEANNKADWTDPEVAKDPAVKARLDLMAWMNTENDNRMKAGLEPIKSFIDANNAMQLENLRSHNKAEEKSETQKRRDRGSRVGGSAPYSPEGSPKGSITGVGGSLSDLVTEYLAA